MRYCIFPGGWGIFIKKNQDRPDQTTVEHLGRLASPPRWRLHRRHRAQSHASSTIVCGCAIGLTVGLTTLADGGFNHSSQSMFVALSGVSLLTSLFLGDQQIADAVRSPPVLVLGALAALCIASVTWSVAAPSAAVLWGMTIAGYAASVVAAAAFTRLAGPWPLAAGIVALAVLEAVLALRALAFQRPPNAEFINGIWRPGGTFQYPPALAILEVGALTIASHVMRRDTGIKAAAAAAAAVLAGTIIVLTGSRLALVLALVSLMVPILLARETRNTRMESVVATILVAAGALTARLALLGHLTLATTGGGWTVLWEIAALTIGCACAWTIVRGSSSRGGATWTIFIACLATAALIATLWTDTHSGGSPPGTRPTPIGGIKQAAPDLLHGRSREWRAAALTWLDRPVLGAGAGAYYSASLAHQGTAATLYAHDLLLELAAELGALGLLLGFALYLANAWAIAAARHSLALELLTPLVVAFLASNLIDWTWHLAGLGALWAAALGGLVGCARQAPDRYPSAATTDSAEVRVGTGEGGDIRHLGCLVARVVPEEDDGISKPTQTSAEGRP